MFEKYDEKICSIFKIAELERKKLKHNYVGTEHILLAILKDENEITNYLNKIGLTYENFLKEIKLCLDSSKNITNNHIYTPLLKKIILSSAKDDNKVSIASLLYSILDEGEGVAIRILFNMGIDVDAIYNHLKEKDNNLLIFEYGKLLNNYTLDETVIGRTKELDLIIETLLRKKKNNPLLIGDAGVGKTAIVEELARMINAGNVPSELKDAKIVLLEMGSLVSGTRYRGEFEERLNNIIKEIISNSNIILFIDEIHTMISAGAAEGAISAGDILKPYLARGDIKCIGATTKSEYEKYFSKDKALMRRFEKILVNEPNEEETIDIIKGIKDEYIKYHKVNVKDDMISIIVHLANTYFPNKKNPDKSIELLDSVMSYVKVKSSSKLAKEKELELKKISCQKINMIEQGNYKEALKRNVIENKLKKELSCIYTGKNVLVTKEDILDVLENKNNIIISDKKIANLSNSKEDVIIKKIINKVKKNERVSSFMFMGNCNKIIEKLQKVLNFEIIKVNDDKSIEKMMNKLKYYPSSIIVINDVNNYEINSIITKAIKDNIVEYNDEYISFNSAIIIYLAKEKTIGFNTKVINNVPVDEIIYFDNQTIYN